MKALVLSPVSSADAAVCRTVVGIVGPLQPKILRAGIDSMYRLPRVRVCTTPDDVPDCIRVRLPIERAFSCLTVLQQKIDGVTFPHGRRAIQRPSANVNVCE